MIRDRIVVLPLLTLALAEGFPLSAQSVVSTHSGVIYFFEGSVWNGTDRLEQKFGRFPDITEGGELRTELGRAEVLLTPGVFLRIDENSSIRMLSNKLSDTRVELVGGSAIVESNEGGADTSVELIYKNWHVRVPHEGVYRIDAVPAQVLVYRGSVEVAAEGTTETEYAGEGQVLPLAAVLVAEESTTPGGDAFKNWAMRRSQAVSADNAIAADIFDDPRQIDASGLALGGFSYFPLTGIPSMSITNPHALSLWSPYQSTLSSIYSPWYLYGPQYLGWPRGLPLYSRPIVAWPARVGIGLHPGGFGSPRLPVVPQPPVVPRPPVAPRPIGAPHSGFHASGR